MPQTTCQIRAPGSLLVSQYPAIVGQHQGGIVNRLLRGGLGDRRKSTAHLILRGPTGGILELKVVFHFGQRHTLIIDRRSELLHAGHLAASIAEAALTFCLATSCREHIAVHRISGYLALFPLQQSSL